MCTRVDKLQRKVVGILLDIRRLPHEDWKAFRARRASSLRRHIDFEDRWSTFVARRIASWNAHARRNHAESWPGYLLSYRDSDFFAQLRAASSGTNIDTRLRPGKPCTRYFEGVRLAMEHLGPEGLDI